MVRPCSCNHAVVPFIRALWALSPLSQLRPSACRGKMKGRFSKMKMIRFLAFSIYKIEIKNWKLLKV
jgi:hypothetical protein